VLTNGRALEDSFRAKRTVSLHALRIGERTLCDERADLGRPFFFALKIRRTFEVSSFDPYQDQADRAE